MTSRFNDKDGNTTGAVSVNRDMTERKGAEETLRRSQVRLAKAEQIAHLGNWSYDISTGHVEGSEELYRIFGHEPYSVELSYEKIRAWVHPKDRDRNDAFFARMQALKPGDRPEKLEYRLLRPDGEERWVKMLFEIEFDEQAEPAFFFGTILDITERKRGEQAIRKSEQVWRLFVEYAPAAMAMFDREMRYIAASRRYLNDYNLEDQILTGRSHYEVFPEMPKHWQAIHQRCLAGAIEKADEDPFPRASGKLDWVRWEIHPWYESNEEIGGIILFSEVITERKQAEEALKRYNERLTVLRQIDRGIVAAHSTKDIVQPALQGIRRLIPCTQVGIALFEMETSEAIVFALDGSADTLLKTGQRLPLGRNQRIEQLAAGQTVMIPDLHLHQPSSSPEFVKQAINDGMRSKLNIPLMAQEQLIGVFILADIQPHYFTAEHQEIAGEVANQLAIAIHQNRLHEQIRRHAQELEQRVADRTAELEEQYRRQAVLEERQRLARELHDVVSQSLFSARVIAESLPRLWERNPELVRSSLTDLHRLTRGALAEMRTLLLELRPAALEEVGLGELLQQLTEGIAGRSQVEISLTVEGRDATPTEVKIALYRMVQEALNNIIKHARAGQISVNMVSRPDEIRLQISDDGHGFNPADRPSGHLGLHIMAERAEAIGARLQISSRIEEGTVINIVWPDTLPEEKP